MTAFAGGHVGESADMAQADERNDGEISIATNLHFVLETQRIGTINESTGRSASFLQSVSMAFIALGFIAPATRLGPEFYAFALAVLGVLLALGLVTFFRTVQLGIDDIQLAVRMQSIEKLYAEHAPALEQSKIIEPIVKRPNYRENMRLFRKQIFLTNASLIAVVDAAIAAALAAVAGHFLSGELAFEIGLSGIAFVATFLVLMLSQLRMWLPVIRNDDA